MGKLNKKTFKHFIKSDCNRRLFLDLGSEDPQWILPLRPIKPRVPSSFIQQSQVLTLGHAYEEEIYNALILTSPSEVKFDRSTSRHFVPVLLNPPSLENLEKQLNQQQHLCLIEHVQTLTPLPPEPSSPLRSTSKPTAADAHLSKIANSL